MRKEKMSLNACSGNSAAWSTDLECSIDGKIDWYGGG